LAHLDASLELLYFPCVCGAWEAGWPDKLPREFPEDIALRASIPVFWNRGDRRHKTRLFELSEGFFDLLASWFKDLGIDIRNYRIEQVVQIFQSTGIDPQSPEGSFAV
jgi:hypothetical protein